MLTALTGMVALAAVVADGVHWEKDYAAAFASAEERNVPVLLCFNMDGESASDSTAARIYRDPEFVERSRDFICLIASAAKHEGAPCPRFGGLTCDEHLKVEIAASEEFVGRDTVISPQHVLISPKRNVLARKAYQAGKAEIFKMMSMAEKAVSTGIGDDESTRLKQLMKLARERNAERRGPAVAELGRMPNIEARDFLLALTNKKEMAATRIEAIEALASKGNYDALGAFEALLKDKSVQIQQHAIVGLEQLCLPAAAPTLLKMWKKKPKTVLAKEIPRALAKCAPEDPDVRKALLKELKKSKEQLVELATIVASASLSDDDGKIVDLYADKLKDRNGNVRGVTVWAVATSRRDGAKELLEAAREKESNAEVRECMDRALEFLARNDPDDYSFDGAYKTFLDDDVSRDGS